MRSIIRYRRLAIRFNGELKDSVVDELVKLKLPLFDVEWGMNDYSLESFVKSFDMIHSAYPRTRHTVFLNGNECSDDLIGFMEMAGIEMRMTSVRRPSKSIVPIIPVDKDAWRNYRNLYGCFHSTANLPEFRFPSRCFDSDFMKSVCAVDESVLKNLPAYGEPKVHKDVCGYVFPTNGMKKKLFCPIDEKGALLIDSNGNVFDCYASSEPIAKLGVSPMKNFHLANSIEPNADCESCEFKYYCGAFCPKIMKEERTELCKKVKRIYESMFSMA